MRKLLLGTAAIALGMTYAASEANAQVKLDVGGHAKLYMSWLSQDTAKDDFDTVAVTPPTTATSEQMDVRAVDILRETELHFTGETTLDNGLTVGVHAELDLDGSDALAGTGVQTEEGYAYFSGAWGRVNFGMEDGAAYLLQVAAPSADSNFDGIRQWIDPVNEFVLAAPATSGAGTIDNVSLDDLFTAGRIAAGTVVRDSDSSDTLSVGDIVVGANGAGASINTRFDYDQAISGYSDKITYLTPVFSGFQVGVSYTPEIGHPPSDLGNNDADKILGAVGGFWDAGTAEWGDVWDLAARYEGMFGDVGISVGGGWSHASLEADDNSPVLYRDIDAVAGFTAGTDEIVATLDDREAWNVGVDMNWKVFGLGGAYMRDDNGVSGDNFQTETWTIGLDYTTGPFKVGGSYYAQDQNVGGVDQTTDRWTGGVVYTYGPGMTFRGSVSYSNFDEGVGFDTSDADATSVLLGTQIDF